MPIFTSNLSPARLAASLQRVRLRGDDGARLRRTSDDEAGEGRAQGAERNARARLRSLLDQLPQNTQLADLVRTRLEESRVAEEERRPAARTEGPAEEPETAPRTEARREALGVGAVRREGEEPRTDRPGTLTPAATNPFLRQRTAATVATPQVATLATARLNVAAVPESTGDEEGRVPERIADARTELQAIPIVRDPETPGLDRVTDAQIRLLASRDQAPPAAIEPEPEAAPEVPTAEQIARANTTPQIRENLQANTQQVGQGLRQEASAAAQQNASRAQQTAEQTAQSGQQREVASNRRQVRQLRTEERRLERELTETEREIRSRENRTSQLQSGVTGVSAAATATRLNIVAI